jgi:FkbM family methyltransferase
MRIRPAQVGDVLKRMLHVRRTIMTSRTGHRFSVDPVSVLGMHLSTAGVHEPTLTRLVLTLLRPSDVFVDIGGNEGYFSVIAAACVGPGAVHCIEPQSRLREHLKRNFELNGAEVTLHELAIADRDGSVDLFLRPSTNTGASSLFRHWKVGSRAERVPCMTLDSFFDRCAIERARLIKIDCEGAEPLIVKGGERIWAAHRVEFVAMEYHTAISGAAECRQAHLRLLRAGYVLTRVSGHRIYHLPSLRDGLTGPADIAVEPACPDAAAPGGPA